MFDSHPLEIFWISGGGGNVPPVPPLPTTLYASTNVYIQYILVYIRVYSYILIDFLNFYIHSYILYILIIEIYDFDFPNSYYEY